MPVTVEIGRHRTPGHELAPGFVLALRADDSDDEFAPVSVNGETAIVAYDDAMFGIQILTLPQRMRRHGPISIDPDAIQRVLGHTAAARRVTSILPSLTAAWSH